MDPERDIRDAVIVKAERDIDRLYRFLYSEVSLALGKHKDQPVMTPFIRAMVLRDVDAAMDSIFGRFQGDPTSRLEEVVADRSAEVRGAMFSLAAEDITEILEERDPELLDAIEERAANGRSSLV